MIRNLNIFIDCQENHNKVSALQSHKNFNIHGHLLIFFHVSQNTCKSNPLYYASTNGVCLTFYLIHSNVTEKCKTFCLLLWFCSGNGNAGIWRYLISVVCVFFSFVVSLFVTLVAIPLKKSHVNYYMSLNCHNYAKKVLFPYLKERPFCTWTFHQKFALNSEQK